MAGSKTDFYAGEVLKLASGKATTLTFPLSDVFVALYTVTPTDTAAGTEATGGGYARKSVKSVLTITDGALTTSTDVSWAFTGVVSGGTTVKGFALLAPGGQALYYGDLLGSDGQPRARAYGADETLTIPAGTLVVTED